MLYWTCKRQNKQLFSTNGLLFRFTFFHLLIVHTLKLFFSELYLLPCIVQTAKKNSRGVLPTCLGNNKYITTALYYLLG